MVSLLKFPRGSQKDPNESEILEKPRINNENCIGLLKNRYSWLRKIRVRIKDRSIVRNVFAYVKAYFILKNSLRIDPLYEE